MNPGFSAKPRALLALAFLIFAAPLASAAGQSGKPLTKQYLDGVRVEIRNLTAETIRLQDDVIHHPAAQKDRNLYKLTEATVSAIARFEKGVNPEASQEMLVEKFDELDKQIRDLTAAVLTAAPQGLVVQRAADRVRGAREELYYALASGDSRQTGQLTRRQAEAFAEATRDLQRTSRYTLDDTVGRAMMIDHIAQLTIAAERFDKSLQNKGDLKQRQADFADVDKAWARVVHGVGLLKPAENVHLLRSAFLVDRLHERMYRLLDIKGKRPSLSVQS